jgi:hypothetical protein
MREKEKNPDSALFGGKIYVKIGNDTDRIGKIPEEEA